MGKESKMNLGDIAKGKHDDIRFRDGDMVRIAVYNGVKHILKRISFEEGKALIYGKINSFKLVEPRKGGRVLSSMVWDIKHDAPMFVSVNDIKWSNDVMSEELLSGLV